jgi:hypothetical protein
LNKSMAWSRVSATDFVLRLSQLEPLDWAFLNDLSLSKPFWDTLKAVAPDFLYKGVKALRLKGTKKPISEAAINKVLAGK